MVVPEHAPVRYLLAGQVVLEHVLQLNPLVVPPHVPDRNSPAGHVLREQALHWLSAAPAHPPDRYKPVPHAAQVLHEKPSVVPEHEPTRCSPAEHLVLAHVSQVKPAPVVVLHAPARYWPPGQFVLPQGVHAVTRVEAALWYCPLSHTAHLAPDSRQPLSHLASRTHAWSVVV